MGVEFVDADGHASHLRRLTEEGAGHRSSGTERVPVGEVRHPEPVEAPHIFPPPDDLADESLGRRNRYVAGPVRRQRGVDHGLWTKEPEVERRAQQCVGKVPVARQHGVFVRTEVGEDFVDDASEPGFGVTRGCGPQARPRSPECLGRMGIDKRAYLIVDVVERERLRGRPRASVLGWWLTILVVVVPPATGRLAVGFDQHVESQPLPTVEVLHLQAPLTCGRPRREVVVGAQELIVGDDLVATGFDEGPTTKRHRHHGPDTHRSELASMGVEAF